MKKKIIDWYRVGRTALQAGSGAAVALVTVLAGNQSREAIIAAAVEFAATVLTAVCMNINRQAREADEYGDDCE